MWTRKLRPCNCPRKESQDNVSTKDFTASAFIPAWPWRDACAAVAGRHDTGLRRQHQGDTATRFHVHSEWRQFGAVDPYRFRDRFCIVADPECARTISRPRNGPVGVGASLRRPDE